MKKNTLHKVMATALVGAMAMSTLTGCGSSADNTTADAGTKESVAESSAASTDAGASTAVAGIDGWEAFADNVTLQIPVYALRSRCPESAVQHHGRICRNYP